MALQRVDGDATHADSGVAARPTPMAHTHAPVLSPYCCSVCAWRSQRGVPLRAAVPGPHSLPPPFHWHRHCCVHVAVPMVRRDHSAMQHAVTAPRMSDGECVPLRRVSALTPSPPRRVVLCACDSVRFAPAAHSRCHVHSLPHPSPSTSNACNACARKRSPCRRMHRSLPPISLLATSGASCRRMLRALSAMHSSAQLLVFMHTKRQCQCSIFYLMRERRLEHASL